VLINEIRHCMQDLRVLPSGTLSPAVFRPPEKPSGHLRPQEGFPLTLLSILLPWLLPTKPWSAFVPDDPHQQFPPHLTILSNHISYF